MRSALPPACIFFSWIADHESIPTDLRNKRGEEGGREQRKNGVREQETEGNKKELWRGKKQNRKRLERAAGDEKAGQGEYEYEGLQS